ncbi:hypothetical protein JRO89_XS03G0309400 [Xanthoceras sorbifolium]|uniref:Uncharacterized protein n=1 Tax=Xanthoceras sorbifolium TaxID=99658 RepID=A0ABQ8ID94_9ROSI|nr:hypothetical protein JRO89_XS03G0309400 [Xanthoceras sorbifolium]
MLQLISVFASNLKVLPQPLDLVVAEFSGGDGGRLGELKSEVYYGVLGLSVLFGANFFKGLKRNVKVLIFGLCCLGILVGLGLRRNEAMKWVDGFRICSPIVEIVGGKRKGRRRRAL